VFIGQNGTVRSTVANANRAEYIFSPEDTYIRTEIRTPDATMYLNPVLRYDGAHLPAPVATVEGGATWLLRGGSLLCGIGLAMALARRRARSPRAVAQLDRGAAVPKRTTA
jgi:hypothetical protein